MVMRFRRELRSRIIDKNFYPDELKNRIDLMSYIHETGELPEISRTPEFKY